MRVKVPYIVEIRAKFRRFCEVKLLEVYQASQEPLPRILPIRGYDLEPLSESFDRLVYRSSHRTPVGAPHRNSPIYEEVINDLLPPGAHHVRFSVLDVQTVREDKMAYHSDCPLDPDLWETVGRGNCNVVNQTSVVQVFRQ